MRKGRLIVTIVLIAVLTAALPAVVMADTGPKPSVVVSFTGVGDEEFYGTLLSKNDSSGPAHVWDGKEETTEISRKFIEYKDTDGYYFLQNLWECSADKNIEWTYFPPSEFKILLYFPESDSFVVSGAYETYAFDSYYTIDLTSVRNGTVEAGTPTIEVRKNYDYKWEIISFFARVIITIAIEMGIALLFGYRNKKILMLLAVVNAATQVILNVLLNIINYNNGSQEYTTMYIIMEVLVFLIEAIIFDIFIPKVSDEERNFKPVIYALVANAVSFGAGLGLSHLIPGIF